MIVRKLSTVYFTDLGVDLKTIGYLNFLGYAWNFKFLWAPVLDIIGTKRRWQVSLQLVVAVLTLLVAAAALRTPAVGPVGATHYLVLMVSIAFLVMAFVSATNDIAIDAYYMEGIRDPRDQAGYSGQRVMAYRLAVIYANSGLVALASLGPNRAWGWTLSFTATGLTMLVLAGGHALWLPRVEGVAAKPPLRQVAHGYLEGFVSYLRQPRILIVLAFILTYKADEIIFSMESPFFMRELHVTKAQLAWLAGLVGTGTAIAGALIGAWCIKRFGLRRAIWPLTLLMNLSIWAFVALAHYRPDARTQDGLALIAVVNGYEHLAAGLGYTVLIVFLLRTCRPEFKAAHYAIGSALMSVPANFVGGFAGRIINRIGWVDFYIAAFLLSIPAMLLIPWLPYKDETATRGATSQE
jgi:MFS transporter, PAT family, beta-lactamase induction signal transducer AmpG